MALEDEDCDGLTPAAFAARAGNVDTMQALAELGANMQAVDAKKMTLAHHAAASGHTEVISALAKLARVQRLGQVV